MRQIGTNKLGLVALLALAAVATYVAAAGDAGNGASADAASDGHSAMAIFAGGCFWCMEGPFDELDGVLETISGYTGGTLENPSYEQVSSGATGHAEAVQIRYDPSRISYPELLAVFWPNIDPTTPDRQFCDRGNQYRPGVFYVNEEQRAQALASLAELEKNKPFSADIKTEITAAGVFYPAEDYHQNYYLKNPVRYKFYRYNCGRDQRLQQLWGSAYKK